jgi:hypothetical protein
MMVEGCSNMYAQQEQQHRSGMVRKTSWRRPAHRFSQCLYVQESKVGDVGDTELDTGMYVCMDVCMHGYMYAHAHNVYMYRTVKTGTFMI